LNEIACYQYEWVKEYSTNSCGRFAQFNLFYGENGSGKTSFLEGIYFLGHGRSFRSHRVDRIIHYDASQLTIFAHFQVNASTELTAVGVERNRHGGSAFRINHQNVSSAGELAALLPMQLINPDSYKLLESGPKFRRQFLDWGLFHVEPSFFSLWMQWQRLLKQRNMALKNQLNVSQITVWDEALAQVGETIHRMRGEYFTAFMVILEGFLKALDFPYEISAVYQPGWDDKQEYRHVLAKGLTRDQQLGHTHKGPHRADLVFKVKGLPAQDVLSRGQQKLLVNSLYFTRGHLLKDRTGKQSLLLIDDLSAELDQYHRRQMAEVLQQLGAQVFITGVGKADLLGLFEDKSTKMFHVEHGGIHLE